MNVHENLKITQKSYDNLKAELLDLMQKRRDIVVDLQNAYDFGDLRENSEFDAAKERQGLVDKRIKQIEHILNFATIIDAKDLDYVDIGSIVTIEFMEDGSRETYEIVIPEEVNIEESKISYLSPLGESLRSKKIGDIVDYTSPTENFKIKIIEIKYPD